MTPLVRGNFLSYGVAPRGAAPPPNFHAVFNPFGNCDSIRAYLADPGKPRTAEIHPDSSVRAWALFGIFRSMNPEGLAQKGRLWTIAAFRGLFGYLVDTQDTSGIFVVSPTPLVEDACLIPDSDGEYRQQITKIQHPGTPQTRTYKHLYAQYVTRAVLGQPFTGLHRIGPEDMKFVYETALHCAIRGEGGTNYKRLLTAIRGPNGTPLSEEATLRVSGLGVRPDIEIPLGKLPTGLPREGGR